MTQQPYLVKKGKKLSPIPADIKSISHPDKYKPTGSALGGFAQFVEVVGINRDFAQIHSTVGWLTVELHPDQIKTKLRRLRQQEADELDAIDQKIHDLHEERNQLLLKAWQKANVVTVKELVDLIEGKEQHAKATADL